MGSKPEGYGIYIFTAQFQIEASSPEDAYEQLLCDISPVQAGKTVTQLSSAEFVEKRES